MRFASRVKISSSTSMEVGDGKGKDSFLSLLNSIGIL